MHYGGSVDVNIYVLVSLDTSQVKKSTLIHNISFPNQNVWIV